MKKSAFSLTRRQLLSSAGAAAATALVGSLPAPAFAQATNAPASLTADGPFTRSTVSEIARRLSRVPYAAPTSRLPDVLKNLTYDQYRDIRFKPSVAVWANSGLPFQLQLFHPGFYFKEPIEVAIVQDGKAKHLPYSTDMFDFGPLVPKGIPNDDFGFAGIRIHGLLNRPDYFDEIVVFQGASYFRSLGKGQAYGISARGLAVKTAEPEGEEFPIFRAFWIETPLKDSETIVLYALLDSPSVTGAYRFTIRPGMPTTMDIEADLFPRVDLAKFGLAPCTSMFFFGPNDRIGVDDFRPEVHDSDGLMILNGRGERLWRPLSNPSTLQISAFVDAGMRGFGLIQRDREFVTYQDLEAVYEKRPSLWVEPVGDWGQGAVTLVEIPTNSEIHDNIVAYWQPKDAIPAGSEYSFAYRLSWGGDPAFAPGGMVVSDTMIGRALIEDDGPARRFVIDFAPQQLLDGKPAPEPKATVTTSEGTVSNVVVMPNPQIGQGQGWRVHFELDPGKASLIELRVVLTFPDGRPSETWVYRWTATA
ncbi:glucans biosynthesis protein [Kaistia hirudinis]|uniref:Glucans biosynthesis protein n=1 Tax=Kaistia hirudinis TaxID=1293440 RepID=A0A840AR02_9HYPH|nr:glucan biosynthesis protein G [Kaistia hirudinis]MBB3931708.1 glucans biosynthesis protein [Kaistia hirudinis]MBN9016345.1 glucan biosynthesis protein [Hyphomicrobiales bacterium]